MPPPPSPTREKPGVARIVGIIAVAIVLAAQILFLLSGLFAALYGATEAQTGVFFLVAGGAVAALVWLLVKLGRRTFRPATAWFAAASIIVDGVLVAGIFSPVFTGACSDQEVAITQQIPSYPGTVSDFGYNTSTGSCGANFGVNADPQDVVAYYQRQLEAAGWTVSVQHQHGQVEGGGDVIAVDVHATRGPETFDIAIESYQGMTSASLYVDA